MLSAANGSALPYLAKHVLLLLSLNCLDCYGNSHPYFWSDITFSFSLCCGLSCPHLLEHVVDTYPSSGLHFKSCLNSLPQFGFAHFGYSVILFKNQYTRVLNGKSNISGHQFKIAFLKCSYLLECYRRYEKQFACVFKKSISSFLKVSRFCMWLYS